jgi:hypothetical protein
MWTWIPRIRPNMIHAYIFIRWFLVLHSKYISLLLEAKLLHQYFYYADLKELYDPQLEWMFIHVPACICICVCIYIECVTIHIRVSALCCHLMIHIRGNVKYKSSLLYKASSITFSCWCVRLDGHQILIKQCSHTMHVGMWPDSTCRLDRGTMTNSAHAAQGLSSISITGGLAAQVCHTRRTRYEATSRRRVSCFAL